jgi:hypothetical protein
MMRVKDELVTGQKALLDLQAAQLADARKMIDLQAQQLAIRAELIEVQAQQIAVLEELVARGVEPEGLGGAPEGSERSGCGEGGQRDRG